MKCMDIYLIIWLGIKLECLNLKPLPLPQTQSEPNMKLVSSGYHLNESLKSIENVSPTES